MRVHFIQHVPYETPGYLVAWAENHQHQISFTKVFEPALFPSTNDFDLLIIMGGPMGVYEEEKYSWLKEEKQFIHKTMEADKKLLGICLGSQLIAEALGAKVYPNKLKEIGWWPVKKNPHEINNPLLREMPNEFISFHWHGDTFDLPERARHLLFTDVCSNQAFQYGNNVLALQFHPEATATLVEAMISHGKEELIHAPFIQQAETMLVQDKHYAQNQHFLSKLLEKFVKK